MSLETQFRLKSNPNYLRYLREHSYWYKSLNRDPSLFRIFEEEVKENYKLRTVDKIEKVMDTIDIIEKLMSTFR